MVWWIPQRTYTNGRTAVDRPGPPGPTRSGPARGGPARGGPARPDRTIHGVINCHPSLNTTVDYYLHSNGSYKRNQPLKLWTNHWRNSRQMTCQRLVISLTFTTHARKRRKVQSAVSASAFSSNRLSTFSARRSCCCRMLSSLPRTMPKGIA